MRLKYKIIITGSNTRLLSSEMATHLTGRFDTFTLFPMSFIEFLRFRSIEQVHAKISVNNMTKVLRIKSQHTIREYIRYIENTFLIVTIGKFSYKLKERSSAFKKIYIIDTGEFNLKEGTILTMSQEDATTFNGLTVKILPVWKWMLT
jgi:predicted AAA+ superfamily ATPase